MKHTAISRTEVTCHLEESERFVVRFRTTPHMGFKVEEIVFEIFDGALSSRIGIRGKKEPAPGYHTRFYLDFNAEQLSDQVRDSIWRCAADHGAVMIRPVLVR